MEDQFEVDRLLLMKMNVISCALMDYNTCYYEGKHSKKVYIYY